MFTFIYATGVFILLYLMLVGATKIYTRWEFLVLITFSLSSWIGIIFVISLYLIKKRKK